MADGIYTELNRMPSATFAPVIINLSQYEFEGFIKELTFRVKESDGNYTSFNTSLYTVWLIAARPDGVVYEIKGTVLGSAWPQNSYVSFPLKKGITDVTGDVICELIWVTSGTTEQNATANFILRVEPSPKEIYGKTNTVIDDSGGGNQPYIPDDPVDEPKYRMVIVSNPTKTTYNEGDTLDLTGVKVNLEKYTENQGILETTDITNACTYSPANGTTLTPSNTAITVSYLQSGTTLSKTIPIAVGADPKQYRLVVATPPNKTTYDEDDNLDLTGTVINLEEYTEARGVISATNVTSGCVFNPANGAKLTSSNTSVTVTYER